MKWNNGMLELLTEYHQVEECHSEPFASCHSDPVLNTGEESKEAAQGKLREESPPAIAVRQAGQRSFALLRMTP
jgi:hypothetical protein